MSGRHTMPPAGRRKAAADSVGSAESETIEDPAVEDPASKESGVEEPAVEQEEAVEPPDADADADEPDADEPDADETEDDAQELGQPAAAEPSRPRSRVSTAVVLAAIALVLAVVSGVLRWLTVTQDETDTARVESVQAAKEITVQMLSYDTDTVEQQLTAARDQMTGEFLGTYTTMINDVIPAAQAQRIAAVAAVLEVGTADVKPDRAEVVLFVNQSVRVGEEVPKRTPSVARATMVKDGGRWLMSKYEPVPL